MAVIPGSRVTAVRNPYALSWLWIPGSRKVARPQMRNCASGNDGVEVVHLTTIDAETV
jgi:hypothetical protein